MLLVVSTIWGLSWVAIKIGVLAIPPMFFAATRFTAAGLFMLTVVPRRPELKRLWQNRIPVVGASLLLITFCYGPLFWGARSTASGITAMINLTLIPIGMMAMGIMAGQERLDLRQAASIAAGVAGLSLLLGSGSGADMDSTTGMLAIAAGTLSGCAGAVWIRASLSWISPFATAGLTMLIGGLGLGILSFVFERPSLETFGQMAEAKVLLSWLYLVIFGSIIAFSLFLHLLQSWGPIRSGLYAFISPVVAITAGYILLAETLQPRQLLGGAILLGAAAAAMAAGNWPTRRGEALERKLG